MARQRSAHSNLHPSCFVKRLLCSAFLCLLCFVSFAVWDRQLALPKQTQDGLFKLNETDEELFLSRNLRSKTSIHQRELLSDLSERRAMQQAYRVAAIRKRGPDEDEDPVARERRDQVKEAMLHAWSSYEKYAWGMDELLPQSKIGSNSFGGLGATIVDSLDTLYIMGLHDQFQKAKEWVATQLSFDKDYDASVFETTIRVLGGLLSAYDLSQEGMFLEKAKDLADSLLPAWHTPTGIPYPAVNLATGKTRDTGSSVLAEVGTEQVELIGLSQRTGNPIYMETAENVITKLKQVFPSDGLLPVLISPDNGMPTASRVTFGAMGDSFYEYLLKVWIQGNKTETVKHYRDMWEQSMVGLVSLTKRSTPSNFLYLAERDEFNLLVDKMDELACFSSGMLALGSLDAPADKATVYLDAAKELGKTCYHFYRQTPTKLSGESYMFSDEEDSSVVTAWNIQRPETVESLMYLWRITGDKTYRDWGWDIFQAFEKQSRIDSGYVGLADVNTGEKDDKMQSFFLAETLKYLYLLFSPSDLIPLDQWVFNTEAHPIRIISRAKHGVRLTDNHDTVERTSLDNRLRARRAGYH